MNVPTKQPSANTQFQQSTVGATAVAFSANPNNLYGFLAENNSSTTDVFLQIFDKAAADVLVGTTVAKFTARIPAGASFGKDAEAFPLMHMDVALSCAVTATRTGNGAPAASATVSLWFFDQL